MVLCLDKAVGQCRNSVPSSHQENIIYTYTGLLILLDSPALHPLYYFRISTVTGETDVMSLYVYVIFCVAKHENDGTCNSLYA